MLVSTLVLLAGSLVAAVPKPVPADGPSDDDGTNTKVTIKKPAKSDNPFPDGIPTMPEECTDSTDPSQECFKAMDDVKTRGYVWKDKSCKGTEADKIDTAVWDAYDLAGFANGWPNNEHSHQAARYYMGPNFDDKTYGPRIAANIKRAGDFKPKRSNYITISCDDPKGWCGKKRDKLTIGGYAWSNHHWFYWDYYFINMCKPFYTAKTLDEGLDLVTKEPKLAQDLTWLQTSGSYILHEMMHTTLIGDPHIIDELVDPQASVYAYMPPLVHQLARRPISQGGGAERASTNADSYTQLMNALYWWDTTNVFPGVPGKPPSETSDDTSPRVDASEADNQPRMIYLGNITGSADVEAMFNTALDNHDFAATGAGGGDPEPSDPSPNPIPAPKCVSNPGPDRLSVGQAEAAEKIQEFCSTTSKKYWDTTLVPYVSYGTGKTSDGGGKALGADESFDVNGGAADKLWMGIFFTEEPCVGSFKFAQGKDDKEKIKYCVDRFSTILNGCDTNTIDEKFGGSLNDVCAEYKIAVAAKDKNDPIETRGKDNAGSFDCVETDVSGIGGDSSSLKNTCTCQYSNIPGNKDVFKKPKDGNCDNVDETELFTN